MKKNVGLILGLMMFLGACSSPVDLAQDALNTVKANAIGTAISQDTTEVLDSMTLANLKSASLAPQVLLGCVEVTGDLSDTDFDLVPAAAVFTYTCNAIGRFGVEASLKGQVKVTDPSSDISINGFDTTVTDLNLKVIGLQSTSYDETRNGTRQVRYSPSFVDNSQDLSIDRTFVLIGLAGTAKITNKLNYRLETSSQEPLSVVSALPSGSVEITGKFNWLSGEDNLSFTVSTPQKLQYDASCQTAPLFSSGELRASLLSASGNGYIRIVYQGCGLEPEIKFIALP